MTLNEWMTKTGTTAGEIARFIERDRSWVQHLRSGKSTPSMKVAQLIAIFTDNEVGLDSWIVPTTPQVESPAPPAQPAAE